MNNYQVSGCCFIRNTFTGAFCIFESMASLLPFVDEMLIMDLGSEDGTLEALREIAQHNKKVKLIQGSFTYTDAGVFATLANDLIAMCQHDNVLYWQSDEVWHEDLLRLMERKFEAGKFDLAFWRIQYANNFQYVKWFPQIVHRVGIKGARLNEGKENFYFDGDGMNTTRMWDAAICSNYGGEMFPQWSSLGQEGIKGYVSEMITDISLLGAFRDNIPDRRRLHAPFWHEEPTIPYFNRETTQQPHMIESHWYAKALNDEDWTKSESPYNLPKILKWHVGRTKYELRTDLFEALKNDTTRAYLGI